MRTRIILAGAVLAGLALPLTGCGDVVMVAESTERRSNAVVRAETQRLYDSTWGTPQARQASEVLAYVAYHEKVAACLAEQGMSYTAGPFLDATAAQRPPLAWYDALVPVDEAAAAQSGFVLDARIAPEIRPTRTWPGRAPTEEAQMACEEQNPYEAPAALDPELDDELYRLVGETVEATPSASPKRYRECMAGEGITVEGERSELVQSFHADRGLGVAAGASERRAAAADARCRSSAHADVMAKLDGPLKQFAGKNAAGLAATPKRADSLQAEAQQAAAKMGLDIDWL